MDFRGSNFSLATSKFLILDLFNDAFSTTYVNRVWNDK